MGVRRVTRREGGRPGPLFVARTTVGRGWAAGRGGQGNPRPAQPLPDASSHDGRGGVGGGAGGDPELEPISADSEPAVGASLDAAVAALLDALPHCPDGDAAALAAAAAASGGGGGSPGEGGEGGLAGVMRAAVAYRLGLKRLLLDAQASGELGPVGRDSGGAGGGV